MKRDKNFVNKKKLIKNIILILVLVFAVIFFLLYWKKIHNNQKEQQENIAKQGSLQQQQDRENVAKEESLSSIKLNEIYTGGSLPKEAWVELYNPSNYQVDLGEYTISSSDGELYEFPKETSIGAGKYLVVGLLVNNQEKYCVNTDVDFVGLKALILQRNNGSIVDMINIPLLRNAESYGRPKDGILQFQYLSPTKGETNNKAIAIAKEYPVFLTPSGFYENGFELEITVSEGHRIYFTTDGSIPNTNSELYTSPIHIEDASSRANVLSMRTDISISTVNTPKTKIDKASIIRAIAVDDSGKSSDVVSATYFIGFDSKSGYNDIGVICIYTDFDNLFDYWKGIYVNGVTYDEFLIRDTDTWIMANYWQNWDCNAFIQYYEPNKVVSYTGDIKLGTFNDIRLDMSQKSLELANLTSDIMYSSLGKLMGKDSNSLILSSGRYDTILKVRNTLIQKLMKDRAVLTHESEPCVVFLNGEYWGVYNIQPDISNEYIESVYSVSSDNVVLIHNGYAENQMDQVLYDGLCSYMSEHNLALEDEYAYVQSIIDIQSLIDCYCCHIYTANSEWLSGNYYMWRSRDMGTSQYEDCKWRFIMYETDNSCGISNLSGYTMNSFLRQAYDDDVLFSALIVNSQFKEQFVNTFMDMANETFNRNKVQSILDEVIENYRLPAVASNKRFFGSTTIESYMSLTEDIQIFFNNRDEYIFEYLRQEFGMSGKLVNVEIVNENMETGVVRLNTIQPNFDEVGVWRGRYFSDYNLQVVAIPLSGYQLECWYINGERVERNNGINTLSVDVNEDDIHIRVKFSKVKSK